MNVLGLFDVVGGVRGKEDENRVHVMSRVNKREREGHEKHNNVYTYYYYIYKRLFDEVILLYYYTHSDGEEVT